MTTTAQQAAVVKMCKTFILDTKKDEKFKKLKRGLFFDSLCTYLGLKCQPPLLQSPVCVWGGGVIILGGYMPFKRF